MLDSWNFVPNKAKLPTLHCYPQFVLKRHPDEKRVYAISPFNYYSVSILLTQSGQIGFYSVVGFCGLFHKSSLALES